MRMGEACNLQWMEVGSKRKTIMLNMPEKESVSKMFKVSGRLIQRIPGSKKYRTSPR